MHKIVTKASIHDLSAQKLPASKCISCYSRSSKLITPREAG